MIATAIPMMRITYFSSGNSPLIPKYNKNPAAAYPKAHNGHICLIFTML
ncbi:MAG: hypothetical protein ACTSVY_16335 [Candidatus Helarchaeota archaeon]